MRDYRIGNWGLAFIFSLEGSVLPRAMVCALPNAILAIGIWYFWRRVVSDEIVEALESGFDTGQVWTGYNWVLGFTVAFRAQRAYSRWWEGGTLLQQARGEWFNAYSSLIAFSSQAAERRHDVEKFQHCLARLMSMLYASALMSVATEPDLDFEVIDATGIAEEPLEYLRHQPDKCEIIMQWVQRLIVDNMGSGVLPIPPPVISRVFQELSRGIVNIHNVRKITEFQFPFPAAQMIVVMLIVQWFITPIATGLLLGSPVWAFLLTFLPTFACWGINYLAGELEQPFGTDFNDMPLHFMQVSMNSSIVALLEPEAQNPPAFNHQNKRMQSIMIEPGKVGISYADSLSPMRSCRYLTIQSQEQLNRVKHRFTAGRDSTFSLRRPTMKKGVMRGYSRERFSTQSYGRNSTSMDSRSSEKSETDFSESVSRERIIGRKVASLRSHLSYSSRMEKTGSDLERVDEHENETIMDQSTSMIEVVSMPADLPPPHPVERRNPPTNFLAESQLSPGDALHLRLASQPNYDPHVVVEDHDQVFQIRRNDTAPARMVAAENSAVSKPVSFEAHG